MRRWLEWVSIYFYILGLVALIYLCWPSQAKGVTWSNSPGSNYVTGEIDLVARIVSSQSVALTEVAPGVMLAEESCTACEDPEPRLSWWRVRKGERFMYAYGGQAQGAERVRTYAGVR